jgi:tetratricopeptide (TPR) repeat protein
VTELLSAIFSVRGFEVTAEVGHMSGALIGFGIGSLMVKLNWVDCERWDLYSIMSGKHSAAQNVGGWQNDVVVRGLRKKDYIQAMQDAEDEENSKRKKRKKPVAKLVELDSLDDSFDELELIDESEDVKEKPRPKVSKAPSIEVSKPIRKEQSTSSKNVDRKRVLRIKELIEQDEFSKAAKEYEAEKTKDPTFEVDEADLKRLGDSLFQAKAAQQAAPLLEEYIQRFPDQADKQRIKLAVLFVKFLQRPVAALKLLAKVDQEELADDYLKVFRKVAKEAQKMVANGSTDRA